MGVGYTRTDTTNNIADGNVINASDLDQEFDAVEAAFNASTGHTHDGTAAEGAPITVVGPAQEWIVDGTALYPKTDNTYDIGKAGAEVKDLYVDGTANIDSLVADTADINGGTFDGVVGGTTPAAGSFTTLSATGNITLSGDIVTDIVIAEASPSITMTDTDTSTDAIISTDNAGSIRIRADNGNAAAASEISFEVDGTVVGTWDADELTVSDTAPTIVLNDTNGTSTNAQMAIRMTGSSVAFTSRDNTGSTVGYDDILIGRSAAGATTFQFNVLGTTTLEVDSGGATVVGDILGDSDIKVAGDGSYFVAQTATATGAVGYELLDNNSVRRSDWVWDGNAGDILWRQYSALGNLQTTVEIDNTGLTATTSGGVAKNLIDQGMEFIESQDASSSSTLDFGSSLFDSSKYDAYMFVFSNIEPSTDGAVLRIRLSASGVYASGATDYKVTATVTTSSVAVTSTDSDGISITSNIGTGSGETGASGRLFVYGPHLAKKTAVSVESSGFDASANFFMANGVGCRNSSGASDGVRFYMSTGNIAAGTITMYGLRNS